MTFSCSDATQESDPKDEVRPMYDTEQPAFRHLQEDRNVHAWMRAAAYAAGTQPEVELKLAPQPEVEFSFAQDPDFGEADLGKAIESKKRDNLSLGEALLSIGLIGKTELTQMQSAQAVGDDLVGSLLVASAIRSRLGEMLLKAKRITSSQLEFALEAQREQGGLLGEILVSYGWLDRQTLDAALAAQASCAAR